MAENNTGPLAEIVGTLLSNPVLMQTALSLLTNGSRSPGGSTGGFDLGSIFNFMSKFDGAPSSSHAESPPETSEKPFDLEAFLASLSESDPSDRRQEANKTVDTPPKAEPSEEKETSSVLLHEPPKKQHGHPHRSDAALLLALRPYLNADRRAMIDNILRIGRFMDTCRQLNTKDGSL